jgi:hypothetical protein
MSFSDAFMSFGASIADTLAKLAAEWVTNELVKGLFGINTAMPGQQSNSGSGLNGIFGSVLSILGFAKGGEVPALNHEALRNSNTALGSAMRKEGNNSVIATLTPGERVLTIEENRNYKRLMNKTAKILSFAEGGEVGSSSPLPNVDFSKVGKQTINNVTIETPKNEKTNLDDRQLVSAIRAVVISELQRQDKIRR